MLFGGSLRRRKRELISERSERSWRGDHGPLADLPVLLIKPRAIKVVRTGEFDSLPWSYRCNPCHTWGHGYATEAGAKRARVKHHCKRLQYNEKRDG